MRDHCMKSATPEELTYSTIQMLFVTRLVCQKMGDSHSTPLLLLMLLGVVTLVKASLQELEAAERDEDIDNFKKLQNILKRVGKTACLQMSKFYIILLHFYPLSLYYVKQTLNDNYFVIIKF